VLALLKKSLLILLVLRAIAAPVTLPTSTPSNSRHPLFVVRMCCWPFQRLQRFSASSKLLQLYSGKNRVPSGEGAWLLLCWPRAASRAHLAAPISRASTDPATERLAVCLRC
jgi:hypothetical protein